MIALFATDLNLDIEPICVSPLQEFKWYIKFVDLSCFISKSFSIKPKVISDRWSKPE